MIQISDPSGMLARIPFGLTTGPIEGAEILVAGCRKETVASEMRSNVLKYRDTLVKRMQEQLKQQHIPVKVYRTDQRLMVAAPMAGLEPENIVVEVTAEDRLILHGDLRGRLKEVKELLLDEWSVGVYHRELALPVAVNAGCANVTDGNSWLMATFAIS